MIGICAELVKQDPDCVKAYYRMGQAWFALGEWKPARANFQVALELDPALKGAAKAIADCKAEERKLELKDRAALYAAYDRCLMLYEMETFMSPRERNNDASFPQWLHTLEPTTRPGHFGGADDDTHRLKHLHRHYSWVKGSVCWTTEPFSISRLVA